MGKENTLMPKWTNIGAIWHTDKGGLSISLDKTMLPEGDDKNRVKLVAFPNDRKEKGSKQPDFRVMKREEEEGSC
jgi:uncharacterized protein (DUF736 family)